MKDDATIEALRAQLDAALAEVSAAERGLEALLAELREGVRAEKVTITSALEAAFTRVRNGRVTLTKVHELIAEDA